MPIQFVGPALQGASLISRVGIPLLQQAGVASGLAGIGAGISALTNKPQTKPQLTGRQKLYQAWGKIPDNLFSPEGGRFAYTTGRGGKATQPSYEDAQGNKYDAVSGRLLYPSRNTVFPAPPVLPPPTFPGQGSTPIVQSSDDAYRQLLSQYGGLQKEKKYEEADKLGMEIWQKKYGKTPMAQPGGAVGAFNPLMQATFGYQKGASVTDPSYAASATQVQPLGGQDFAIAANAVPAPWNQQGAMVDANRGVADLQPEQAKFTTGEGMPAFPTTGEKAAQLLSDPQFARLLRK